MGHYENPATNKWRSIVVAILSRALYKDKGKYILKLTFLDNTES